MKNPRFANAQGGIRLDYDEPGQPSLYVDSGPLYDRAIAGEFGPVGPIEPRPGPTDEEIVAEGERIAAEHAAAEAARLERIATARANMEAAQSVPDLRAAVAVLFAELGI